MNEHIKTVDEFCALYPDMIDQHNNGKIFYTTWLFWDCECVEYYIHPITEEECERCGFLNYDMPDARIHEILFWYPNLLKSETDEYSLFIRERDAKILDGLNLDVPTSYITKVRKIG